MTDDPFLNKPSEGARPAEPTGTPEPYVPPAPQPPAPPTGQVPAPPNYAQPDYAQPDYAQPGYAQPGYPPVPYAPPPGYAVTKPKTWMNWVAFGCGIAGFFTCITAIVAIVFGHLGLAAVKRGEADQRGFGLAGLIMGYVAAIGYIAYVVIMFVFLAILAESGAA